MAAGGGQALKLKGDIMEATKKLKSTGQSLWLEHTAELSTATLESLRTSTISVTGLTSNSDDFDNAIKNSTMYDVAHSPGAVLGHVWGRTYSFRWRWQTLPRPRSAGCCPDGWRGRLGVRLRSRLCLPTDHKSTLGA